MLDKREHPRGRATQDKLRSAAKKIIPLWVAAVLVGSFLPGYLKVWFGTHPYVPNHPVEFEHRLVHFVTFGITSLLFMFTAEKRIYEAPLAGAAFLLGCLIELGQYLTRLAVVFEWWDVRDDLFACFGAFLAFQAATYCLDY